MIYLAEQISEPRQEWKYLISKRNDQMQHEKPTPLWSITSGITLCGMGQTVWSILNAKLSLRCYIWCSNRNLHGNLVSSMQYEQPETSGVD